MKKGPPDAPEKGDRAEMRGNPDLTGTVLSINPENNWVRMAWDEGKTGPRLCHRFELRKIC